MADKTKIIRITPEYDVVQWLYNGRYWCTFRFWKDGSGLIEVKADESFAKSNGYDTIEDYFRAVCDYKALLKLNRTFPEWLRIDDYGTVSYLCQPWQNMN